MAAGTYHAFDFAKYPAATSLQLQYRFKRRFKMRTLLPRMLAALVAAPPRLAQLILSDRGPGADPLRHFRSSHCCTCSAAPARSSPTMDSSASSLDTCLESPRNEAAPKSAGLRCFPSIRGRQSPSLDECRPRAPHPPLRPGNGDSPAASSARSSGQSVATMSRIATGGRVDQRSLSAGFGLALAEWIRPT